MITSLFTIDQVAAFIARGGRFTDMGVDLELALEGVLDELPSEAFDTATPEIAFAAGYRVVARREPMRGPCENLVRAVQDAHLTISGRALLEHFMAMGAGVAAVTYDLELFTILLADYRGGLSAGVTDYSGVLAEISGVHK